jgi:AsmA protein
MAERARRSPGRRIAVITGTVAGAIVLLLVALVLVLQTGPASRRVRDAVVPRLSAAIGREVKVSDARLRILPNPRVVLAGAEIAGRAGEPPLAKLDSLDVEVRLWPLVRSLGSDVEVEGITLVRPEVNLVRAKDGSWNYEGLGGGAAAEKPAAKEPGKPEAADGGPTVFVARARLQDGALRLVDRSQGRDDAAVALTKMDLDASGGLGEKLEVKFSAALAAEQKNVELDLSSPRLPGKIAPGSYPELQGRFAVRGLALQRLRGLLPANLAQIFTGGRVDAEAKLSSEPGGAAYRLEGGGKLAELRLRGEPASGSFTLRGRADPKAGTARLEVTDLAVKGPGVDMGGTATLETKPVRARFALKGALLDLGTVLGLVPQDPSAAKAPASDVPEGALLPPAMAREVEAVDVAGTIAIDRVVNGKLAATDVRARAALRRGVFALEQASAALYGGKVDAGGTEVRLADRHPSWNLKARLEQVDLGQAFQAIAGTAPLQGRTSGSLDLAGTGANWDALKKVLTGAGALSVKEGALTTTDLGDQALGAVAQGLEKLGRGGAAKRVGGLEGGKTTLRDLAASFTVKDGFLALSKPIAFGTAVGQARLGGKIGLSQELALDGALALSKEALARAGIPLGSAEVPLRLGGTLTAPAVQLDAGKALAGAASGLVAEKKEAARKEVEQQARKKAEGFLRQLGK